MFFIWRGRGGLVPLITFAICLLGNAVADDIGGKGYWDAHRSVLALMLLLSGAVVFYLGRLWTTEARTLLDEASGERFSFQIKHDFFWIPMKYWGVIIATFGVAVILQAVPPAPTIIGSAAAYREAQAAIAQATVTGSAAAYYAAHVAVEKATGRSCAYACKVAIASMSQQDADAVDRATIDAIVGGASVDQATAVSTPTGGSPDAVASHIPPTRRPLQSGVNKPSVDSNQSAVQTSASLSPPGSPATAPAKLADYQLRQWGVNGNPAAKGTLRVRASILNATNDPVPYPLLRVSLADQSGGRIGQREFEPAEYLGKTPSRMLAPGELADAVFDIVDPGKDAEEFEIDVCIRGDNNKLICAADPKVGSAGPK
jgi:hypothetical protein